MENEKKSCSSCCPFMLACWAGLVATAVMTIAMLLAGNDSSKNLGEMFIGTGQSSLMTYLVGGGIHLLVGVIFAFTYVFLFTKCGMPALLKGIIFAVLITAVAWYGFPILGKVASLIRGDEQVVMNPCSMEKEMNPCNPCMHNPCNPCGMEAGMGLCESSCDSPMKSCCNAAKSSCNSEKACMLSNSTTKMLLTSLGNHLIYAIVLALVCSSCGRRCD